MNSSIISEKSEKKEAVFGVASQLCRGRSAFAVSHINSTQTGIEGEASFYYTPLGMLVYVSVWGIDVTTDEVYTLELVNDAGVSCILPPLYCKNGKAWCSALTGKIVASDILGGRIGVIKKRDGVSFRIAEGKIRPPRLDEIRLRLA